jgi:hypothetical protein
MTDRQNVALFRDTLKRAYTHQKKAGAMRGFNGAQMKKLDRLFNMNQSERVVARDGRVLFFWRTFRRRAAILYARQHGTRVRYQLNWGSLWEWILENWQTIVRTIIFLVPFII